MEETGAEELLAGIEQLRDKALARGFKPPLYFTCVSADGVMMFVRSALDDDGELVAEKIADHWPVTILRTPFNVMLTDSTGQIALMKVRHPEGKRKAEPDVIWPRELPETD